MQTTADILKVLAAEFARAITVPCPANWIARRGGESLYSAFVQFRQIFPFPCEKISESAFNKTLQAEGFVCARTRIQRYVR